LIVSDEKGNLKGKGTLIKYMHSKGNYYQSEETANMTGYQPSNRGLISRTCKELKT
jgi:hypothetical protein